MKELESILGSENVKYNEPMSKHTTFKVGGIADIFITVNSKEKLLKTLEMLKNEKITIVGNGSNLLVTDEGIRGIVLKYTANTCEINDTIVKVDSGMTNARLANTLLNKKLTGYEFAAGIPGTIGGAIVMNAGAYGREMKDVVLETEFLDFETNEIKVFKNEESNFEYRKSIFENKKGIILSATFKFEHGNKNEIDEKMKEYAQKRKDSQPLDMPSAGSTFKRGNGFITAKLIDESGLKGYSIGGAEVSTKHAGFIVNKGKATAKDIIDLIKYVQKEIYQKFGEKIEPEIKIIGE